MSFTIKNQSQSCLSNEILVTHRNVSRLIRTNPLPISYIRASPFGMACYFSSYTKTVPCSLFRIGTKSSPLLHILRIPGFRNSLESPLEFKRDLTFRITDVVPIIKDTLYCPNDTNNGASCWNKLPPISYLGSLWKIEQGAKIEPGLKLYQRDTHFLWYPEEEMTLKDFIQLLKKQQEQFGQHEFSCRGTLPYKAIHFSHSELINAKSFTKYYSIIDYINELFAKMQVAETDQDQALFANDIALVYSQFMIEYLTKRNFYSRATLAAYESIMKRFELMSSPAEHFSEKLIRDRLSEQKIVDLNKSV